MRLRSKLQNQSGSVLATVLLVLVILLAVFLSAMTYALSRYGHHAGNQNLLIASHLSEAGIPHAINQLSREGIGFDSSTYEAPNGGDIATEVHPWGPYLLVISRGTLGSKSVTTSAVIGSVPSDLFRAAVTLCEENSPLTVAGHTRVVGDINTGHLGVVRGRFRGEGIPEESFHTGVSREFSRLDVPEIDTVILNSYYDNLKDRRRSVQSRLSGSVLLGPEDTQYFENVSSTKIENNLDIKGLSASRFDQISSLFARGSIEITGNSRISGTIELVSDRHIDLRDSATVDGAILWAEDSIVICDYARFSGIAISPGKIIIRDEASLAYPALVLADLPESSQDEESGLQISSRGLLEAVCIVRHDPDIAESRERLLYLDTACIFTGFLISAGQCDIRGRVAGSIVTEQFHYDFPPTTYVNWLKGVHVNRQWLDYLPTLPITATSDSSARYGIVRQDRVQ